MTDVTTEVPLRVSTLSVETFLEHLAARVPAPGGGATAALHVAQAAALLAMVGRYTSGPNHIEHADEIAAAVDAADTYWAVGLSLAEADAGAFSAVAGAYALPRSSPAENAARGSAIADALCGAASPPASVIEVAEALIDLAEALLPLANRNVITDIAAATEAARAAATTARLNVEINLRGIRVPAVRQRLTDVVNRVDEIASRAAGIERTVRESLR